MKEQKISVILAKAVIAPIAAAVVKVSIEAIVKRRDRKRDRKDSLKAMRKEIDECVERGKGIELEEFPS